MIIKKVVLILAITIMPFIAIASETLTPTKYHRNIEQTYLTFPEWWLVYSSNEYANFIKYNNPSNFPYLSSIGQFWSNYWKIYSITKDKYKFNVEYHATVFTIGISTTLEYTFKALYENTIGRVTELLRTHGLTDEDIFAYETAINYVNFIYTEPWYKFSFSDKLTQLWKKTNFTGHDKIRKIERKFILSAEYAFKAGYAWFIKVITQHLYTEPDPTTIIVTSPIDKIILKEHQDIKIIDQFKNGYQLVALPRYDIFKNKMLFLAQNGINFYEVAGNNSEIILSAIIENNVNYDFKQSQVLFTNKILTRPYYKRVVIKINISSLSKLLVYLSEKHAKLEHIYDY